MTLPVVVSLGDSITDENSTDYNLGYYSGWLRNALARKGIPNSTMGVSGLSLAGWLGSGNDTVRTRAYAMLALMKATHVIAALATNDWGSGQTAAALIANYTTLKGQLDAIGPKLILCTSWPRTNAANNAQNGSETVTWAQRAIFNAWVRTNPFGYGYFDAAAVVEDPVITDLWRTDLLKVTAAAVAAGGTGYATSDEIYLPSGILLSVASVSGGVVTGLTVTKMGGFLVAPSNPVSPIVAGLKNSGGSPGTGLTVNLTTGAFSLSDIQAFDGVHPGVPFHALVSTAFEAQADALLA